MGGVNYLGEENMKQYNVIAIDQRGLGRSWPSFMHDECTFGRDDDGDFIDPPKNPSDSALIKTFLQMYKERVFSCWACDACDFQLNATQKDGSVKTYHFLEYAGTKELAEDLYRFREAIKAEKLSLYGVSYGTQVMSTFGKSEDFWF